MLRFLTALATASLGGAIAIALLLALTPSLECRFVPGVRYRVWKWLATLLMVVPPLMALLPAFPLPHIFYVETPQVLEEPRYRGMDHLQADREYARVSGDADGVVPISPGSSNAEISGDDGRNPVTEGNSVIRTDTENGMPDFAIPWLTLLFLAWLLGALIHCGFVWGYYRENWRIIRRWGRPAGEADLTALATAQAVTNCPVVPALRRCPKDFFRTPFVIGFLHPTVVLPESIEDNAREQALPHELIHLRERHLWDLALFNLVRALHWFNPLVGKMVDRAKVEQERYCDWSVCHDKDDNARRAYGKAILSHMDKDDARRSSLTTAFSGDNDEIENRFYAIMDRTPRKQGRVVAFFLSFSIFLVILNSRVTL